MELQPLLQRAGPLTEDPLIFVLLGHTGVGKSASGNTILQRPAFESRRTFISVTTEISEQPGQVGEQQVRVVDTPAIHDKEEEIRAYCQELMKTNQQYVFLFVLKIDRFTQEQHNALRTAMDTVGEEGQNRGILLFTSGDNLGDMTLDQFINENPESPLVTLVQEFEDRIHVFNNSQGGQQQVHDLIKMARKMHEASTVDPGKVHMTKKLKEVRVVLFGLPGVGKSSSGNTILGSKQFKNGCNFNCVSTSTVAKSAEVNGRTVTVVDTPGFTDAVLTPEELFSQIGRSIVEADPGPHAFVIVVKIGRISKADCLLFQLLAELFDQDHRYFTVLFTHKDNLEGENIEELINSNPSVSELVSKCGGKYTVFNNKKKGNLRQVQSLLKVIDKIHSENDGKHCTVEMLREMHQISESPAAVTPAHSDRTREAGAGAGRQRTAAAGTSSSVYPIQPGEAAGGVRRQRTAAETPSKDSSAHPEQNNNDKPEDGRWWFVRLWERFSKLFLKLLENLRPTHKSQSFLRLKPLNNYSAK